MDHQKFGSEFSSILTYLTNWAISLKPKFILVFDLNPTYFLVIRDLCISNDTINTWIHLAYCTLKMGTFIKNHNSSNDEKLTFLDLTTNSKFFSNSSKCSIRSNLANSNKGKYYLNQEDDINASIASLIRKVEAMELKKIKKIKYVQEEEVCSNCELLGHSTNEYPNIPIQANFMKTFKKPFHSQYSEIYNLQWRNHPNFSWRDDNCAQSLHSQKPPNLHSYPTPHTKSLKETLKAFMHEQTNINNQTSQAINEIKSTLSTLTASLQTHEKDKFLAQSQPNPSTQCHVFS
ncbi:hypothetical protein Pfo_025690 [Paulownia fortunei]|nr:hypothetical protein Pfo_025690 [Paulownia fortunei]